MIDKVDLRIPASAHWVSAFRLLGGFLVCDGRYVPFERSKYYTARADLRPIGLDAHLHIGLRFGPKADHKLEILETGKKTLSQMAEIVKSVFQVECCSLPLMRLDVAADIVDIPVEYLRARMRVRLKRKTNEIGVIEYEDIGDRQVQYLRFGKRPSLIRAYDKPAECKARLPEILKRVSKDAEVPTFEQCFGFPENAIITRVERQMGGGRIPAELATFGLLKRAADFDPFTDVEIIPSGEIPIPDRNEYDPAETIKILGTHSLIAREGYQNAFARLNRDHNGKRHVEPYLRYLQRCAPVLEIDRAQMTELFRKVHHSSNRGFNNENRTGPRSGENLWVALMPSFMPECQAGSKNKRAIRFQHS